MALTKVQREEIREVRRIVRRMQEQIPEGTEGALVMTALTRLVCEACVLLDVSIDTFCEALHERWDRPVGEN